MPQRGLLIETDRKTYFLFSFGNDAKTPQKRIQTETERRRDASRARGSSTLPPPATFREHLGRRHSSSLRVVSKNAFITSKKESKEEKTERERERERPPKREQIKYPNTRARSKARLRRRLCSGRAETSPSRRLLAGRRRGTTKTAFQ